MVFSAFAALALLVVVVTLRPHGWALWGGSVASVALAVAGGAVAPADLVHAFDAQWRPFITLLSIMLMTASAERLGIFDRLAAAIEPRTRGPVHDAFRLTFALSAVVAAVMSNDAAILVLTPTVLTLIRTVYPRRHVKFLVPFAFAVFGAAGVAPLVISNPMNLVFADQTGIGFNAYALVMAPVAAVGWVVTYRVLCWVFRRELADEAPALGAWPSAPGPLRGEARVVLSVLVAALLAYPVVAFFEGALWIVAAAAAVLCLGASHRAKVPAGALLGGVSWSLFPFLVCVFVLALGLERAGVVERLLTLYRDASLPIATVGVTSALGSAVLNNHPMSVLNALAIERLPGPRDPQLFAALVGGDLGPRLLPMGSLAGLLWFDSLRKHDVEVTVRDFVRVGALVTAPSLAVSLAVVWLLA